MLVVGELAGSLVLVTCAGLLVRSLSHQLNANLGFDAVHGVTFEVSLPPLSYPERPFATGMEHAAAVQFLSAALDNIRALPGVTAAGIGKPLPLSGAQQATRFHARRRAAAHCNRARSHRSLNSASRVRT